MCDKITFVFFLARGFFIAFFVMVKISRCKDNKKNCGLRIFPLQSLHLCKDNKKNCGLRIFPLQSLHFCAFKRAF